MTIASSTDVESAAQEARETAAQTKAEAAKGDQQAARKLALTQQQAPKAPITEKGLDATA